MDDEQRRAISQRLERARRSAAMLPAWSQTTVSREEKIDLLAAVEDLLTALEGTSQKRGGQRL